MSVQDDLNRSNDMPPRQVLLQMVTGFWTSQAIYVAAKLGIADLLTEESKSSDELAKSVSASPRELYRLLRCLASIGIFTEEEDGRFALTQSATVLQSDTPGSLRSMAIMYGEEIYQAWGNALHSVTTGETAFNHVYGSGHFQYLAQHPEAASVFNQAMTAYTTHETAAIINAYDFTAFENVVDIGGGQGSFLASLFEANPDLHGTLFDLPQVCLGAQEYMETAGFSDRCNVVGGDFFVSVPGEGDAYIVKNIALNWDDEQCIAILKNCRRAIAEHGTLLIIEAVIPPRNVSSFSKLLDLHMLMVTGGRGRTETEFRDLFSAAGFQLTTVTPTRSPTCIIEGRPV